MISGDSGASRPGPAGRRWSGYSAGRGSDTNGRRGSGWEDVCSDSGEEELDGERGAGWREISEASVQQRPYLR